ncbi:hypothetical protein SS1G_08743 [Sclerotinia sclerotiorum 1980 UF-70]|uniref:U4/U6.U5 small nuclear ribonucleoprotein 27kDa protein domain-containing protein n=1 Tax=Sclerotinia sclerotiorum (strain ATCC 18683 / 1980 / Ss-1) TaxID=665079 RepID=A7ETT6_SCLS1|nr:hypothetical protein SS1G_08743 [Sclerotinia sclerotiorum 1980 UF-70]EDN92878.1 hypothetical protein SS1G_08743 [Sclerotinia sclerotiorum 1980 UF-70]
MAEPPRRRQRPDSTKMWEESEKRGPARDRDDKNDRGDRRDDRNRNHDRNRRDRSRSPRDSRDHRRSSYRDRDRDRERERDRGGRRDDRDGRDNDRNRDYRERNNERSGRKDGHRTDVPDRTRGEFMPDALSQTMFALRGTPNIGKEDIRQSREKDEDRNGRKGKDETSRRSECTDDRITPQPVSFSIGAGHTTTGQDHDRMDIDGGNKKKKSQPKKKIEEEVEEEDDDIVVEDDGMAAMQAMMGFGGFATTQNKQVPGNNVSAVRKEKKTEYRQYMNRVGGFNRPLSPSRD